MTRFERVFVWAGGAAFVTSLSMCAWWYGVRLGRPAPTAGWSALAWDMGIFTVFALHHSLCGHDPIKRWLSVVPPRLLRSVYVWTASLLLIGVCLVWQPVGGDVYDVGGVAAGAFASVQLAGLWITARAVARIDPLELAGIRPAAAAEALQIDGPYRWVRHPVYLGWLLMVFGAAHLTRDRLAFATISSLYLFVAVPWEERSLRQLCGEAYVRYERQVKWRIIPFVY
jgi:protein-S-isoprenylcysteine O-methyltransferase Ste14